MRRHPDPADDANPLATARTARPFLKWVGGKGKLLPELRAFAPPSFGRYFEPFIGGGAFFFSLGPKRARLGDINAELIGCYAAIRDDVDAVIAKLRKHRYDESYYYGVRALDPTTLGAAARAARLLFLNRAGFNGLYRVNRAGQFNVPFGRYTNPTLCDAANLRACSLALGGVDLVAGDFAVVVKPAKAGDFVYFDPPYVPVSTTANFTSYASNKFGIDQQYRLAETVRALSARGVHVLASNSDTDAVRQMYSGFDIHRVRAARSVNSDPTKRGKVFEVIVRNF